MSTCSSICHYTSTKDLQLLSDRIPPTISQLCPHRSLCGITHYYTEFFCLSTLYGTKSRIFPYIQPIWDDIKKFSVYSALISGIFLVIMPNSYTIKNFSGDHCGEKPPKKLLEQVSNVIYLKHYSYKTEKVTLTGLNVRFCFIINAILERWEQKKIAAFLTHLAVEENVSASTQNQALNAILFLYREVLKQELDLQVDAVRAKRSRYIPTGLTKEEVLVIINNLSGIYQLTVITRWL